MAWITSAYTRARPVLWELSAVRTKAVLLLKFVILKYALRQPPLRLHPGFAIALPLAALGFLAPFLPIGLTAILLTTAAASCALFAIIPLPELALRILSPKPHLRAPPTLPLPAYPQASPASVEASEIEIERETQRQLAQSAPVRRQRAASEQRDRAWTDLMARVSHDLRTPLNAVMGFSEIMALEMFGPLGDERYHDYVHHIRDSAAELLKSAEDTMALTALMASPSRRDITCACNLELLAADAWAFVSRTATSHAIDFAAFIPSELEVLGEPRALRQIMVNMMSEAVSRAAYGERVVVAAIADGELIEIAVSVSRERERVRASRKGGSLSLCLARTLLEMHGTSLIELEGPNQGWRAVTALDRATQPDFFIDTESEKPRLGVPALVG
jgi:signal transduction histidine kinase